MELFNCQTTGSQQQQAVKDIRKALSARPECVMIPFSATSKAGREECLDLIEKILLTKEDSRL